MIMPVGPLSGPVIVKAVKVTIGKERECDVWPCTETEGRKQATEGKRTCQGKDSVRRAFKHEYCMNPIFIFSFLS
jgi:hypothetical protein